MRVGILIGVAGLILPGGCAREAPPDEAAPAAQAEEPAADAAPIAAHGSLNAPIPDDVATVITAADNDRTISVRVGTKIAVSLLGVPTAGYVWGVEEAPDFLEAAGETGGPTSTAQLEEGFAGGNHWEVFFFKVTSEGSGVLRLEQRRPWETDEPAAETFSVTIAATAGE